MVARPSLEHAFEKKNYDGTGTNGLELNDRISQPFDCVSNFRPIHWRDRSNRTRENDGIISTSAKSLQVKKRGTGIRRFDTRAPLG
jgi:hypothetical protein